MHSMQSLITVTFLKIPSSLKEIIISDSNITDEPLDIIYVGEANMDNLFTRQPRGRVYLPIRNPLF